MTKMKTLRDALHLMHRRAMGDREAVYMSIPPDPTRDADLLLAGALDELEQLRARVEASERANAALREALEGLIPDPKYTGRGVERGTACGRNYLGVNGVVVAMEGDICRSVGFGKPNRHVGWDDQVRWTREDFDRIEREFRAPLDEALATDADKDFVPRADPEAVQAHCNDVTTELHRQLDAMRAERDQFAADAEELRHCVKVMEREGGADIDWSDARNTSFGWSGQVRLKDGRRYYPHFLLDERDAARSEVARLREVLVKVADSEWDGSVSPEVAARIETELAVTDATDSAPWLREKLTRVATAAVEAQRREHQTAEDIAAIVDAEVSR